MFGLFRSLSQNSGENSSPNSGESEKTTKEDQKQLDEVIEEGEDLGLDSAAFKLFKKWNWDGTRRSLEDGRPRAKITDNDIQKCVEERWLALTSKRKMLYKQNAEQQEDLETNELLVSDGIDYDDANTVSSEEESRYDSDDDSAWYCAPPCEFEKEVEKKKDEDAAKEEDQKKEDQLVFKPSSIKPSVALSFESSASSVKEEEKQNSTSWASRRYTEIAIEMLSLFFFVYSQC